MATCHVSVLKVAVVEVVAVVVVEVVGTAIVTTAGRMAISAVTVQKDVTVEVLMEHQHYFGKLYNGNARRKTFERKINVPIFHFI